ncbi:TetR/AcrR family transcriptional regulator [Gordonia crocea]|uniref:TetR family transcriptional regulator n=1 Tax=Gordonia crocea TaxID=589162 RepID=A0A7I9V2A2_9ACTN|nr:TetR/AcrR family transcriptional regulator [Gordonia crocea]GED99159.1 TetR family transcriptional regulator [Gordonia crocea]
MTECSGQSAQTQQLLLDTAEELFARHGFAAVSNRQICEAAGQGNNYAIGYHFGSRDGLLTALLKVRNEPIERARRKMVDELGEDAGPRDWLRCLVRPQLEFMGTTPGHTPYGVFCMQMAADPTTNGLLYDQAAQWPALLDVIEGTYRAIPDLPAKAVEVRTLIMRNVLITTFADFERVRNQDDPPDTESWRTFVDAMVDGLFGLWTAPAT